LPLPVEELPRPAGFVFAPRCPRSTRCSSPVLRQGHSYNPVVPAVVVATALCGDKGAGLRPPSTKRQTPAAPAVAVATALCRDKGASTQRNPIAPGAGAASTPDDCEHRPPPLGDGDHPPPTPGAKAAAPPDEGKHLPLVVSNQRPLMYHAWTTSRLPDSDPWPT
jgi:hypothetical protein